MTDRKVFYGAEYLQSLREHYPEHVKGEALLTVDGRFHIGFVKIWSVFQNIVGVDSPDRFQKLAQRPFGMVRDAWSASRDSSPEGLRRISVG